MLGKHALDRHPPGTGQPSAEESSCLAHRSALPSQQKLGTERGRPEKLCGQPSCPRTWVPRHTQGVWECRTSRHTASLHGTGQRRDVRRKGSWDSAILRAGKGLTAFLSFNAVLPFEETEMGLHKPRPDSRASSHRGERTLPSGFQTCSDTEPGITFCFPVLEWGGLS